MTDWKEVTVIRVDGIPKGQPRQKHCARMGKNGKPFSRNYDPGTASDWKTCIRHAALRSRPAEPFLGPLRVDCVFMLPRPAKLMRQKDPEGCILHTGKPDRDNLDKCVLDALTQIGMWRDDAQVCAGHIRKVYHEKAGRPGAIITIYVPEESPAAALGYRVEEGVL